jgi:hypothetical protein
LAAKDVWRSPKYFFDLFNYNHERPFPAEAVAALLFEGGPSFTTLMAAVLLCGLAGAALGLVTSKPRWFARVTMAMAVALSILLSAMYWPLVAKHWSQRELTAHYFQNREAPDEPLVAFLMNWKGETFYTRNQVIQQMQPDAQAIQAQLVQHPRTFFVVEHSRLALLQSLIGKGHRVTPIAPETVNKFVLVVVEKTPL